jgi:hypothetical protein
MNVKTLVLVGMVATLASCGQDEEVNGHEHGPNCNHAEVVVKPEVHVHGPTCNLEVVKAPVHVHGPACNHGTSVLLAAVEAMSNSFAIVKDSPITYAVKPLRKVDADFSVRGTLFNSKNESSIKTKATRLANGTFQLNIQEPPTLDTKSVLVIEFKDGDKKEKQRILITK